MERALNEEAHNAAQSMIGELFVVNANLPLYHGQESLVREEEFLLISLIPKEVE